MKSSLCITIGIGSGGSYALAAARALVDQPNLNAEQVALKAIQVAAEICVYTNSNFVVEKLGFEEKKI